MLTTNLGNPIMIHNIIKQASAGHSLINPVHPVRHNPNDSRQEGFQPDFRNVLEAYSKQSPENRSSETSAEGASARGSFRKLIDIYV